MKHLEKNIWVILTAVIILIISPVSAISAQEAPPIGENATTPAMDSVEISLITCSPHEEIYSLYGHTALRYRDMSTGEDIVFNWGIFNFNAPHFVVRFVFGLTDYELGPAPFGPFCRYYQKWGSSVTEQVLNLTAEDKLSIRAALEENLREENRVYRYNYFYDNCSTRPRDIIERNIAGKVIYQETGDTQSYREMVHQCTRNHPWAKFGNDMLLGLKADLPTTRSQQEFLPENLMYDFDHAQIYENGEYRPLVKARYMPVAPGVQVIEEDFPLPPLTCAFILFGVSVAVMALEWKRRKTYKYWDAALMTIQGLAGCILFAMLFSQHPTTSTNLQLLLINPLPLLYIPAVVRRKKTTRWWTLLAIMIVMFLLGRIFQTYAEGMVIVALCLLTRYLSHYRNAK